MSGQNSIKYEKLIRLIGTPAAPVIVDVRNDEDFTAAPLLVPGARRRDALEVQVWGAALKGKACVVLCHHGGKFSEGVAAWLRHMGCDAVGLEGGFTEWQAAKLPLVPVSKIPL